MNELPAIYEKFGGYLTPEEEAALWSTAVHEAAHGFVSVQLLGGDSEELVLATNGVSVFPRGDKLQDATASWAGIISEALFSAPHKSRTLPPFSLTKSSLGKWVDAVRLHELSREDREGIEGYHNRYESARLSFEILNSSKEVVEYLARRLAEKCRKDFVESTFRTAEANEQEISKFVREQNEIARRKVMDKRLQKAVVDAEQIVSNLPPCRVPTQFDIESFKSATGATDSEIREFCAYRVQRERWEVGLGAPSPEAIETAVTFFCSNAVHTRDSWIFQAREFAAWKNTNKKI